MADNPHTCPQGEPAISERSERWLSARASIPYVIVDAKWHHCGALGRKICDGRCFCEAGVDPIKKLRECFSDSIVAKSVVQDGKVIAMGGIKSSLMGKKAEIWCAISSEFARHPIAVVKEAKAQLRALLKIKPELCATVPEKDVAAIRFAKILGFKKTGEPRKYGLSSVYMFPMTLKESQMGLRFATENYVEVYDEASPLMDLHWQEIAKNKQLLKLNPDREFYDNVKDNVLLVTARMDGKLIGYFVWFVFKHHHYADVLTAEEDIHFLLPDYRKGMTGYLLMKNARDAAIAAGAKFLVMREKIGKEHPAILKRLGFKPTDIVLTHAVG